ncbi:ABC transporter substrate-binding protein [Micromonospora endophytica]|uniref:ABC transporter substrate-binding protein n=1 Tax=Micromonospora endophytica TaxID=515350 RepID=A0A2W2CUM0_9ACTN|nr:ABC transporter substrate-binding protein [Micromonospora endophytica]PZF97014.1 ABC transporter substrate-binding protein [Micromonospora endophytica]RIW41191.1 ABC transporter substrate-binding protein [Micromonospora endophytica]BCJ58179.1 ABC transporter substrate-binding protein [Micromonospora endophytica]
MTPNQTTGRSRWRLTIATAVAVLLLAVSGCSGSSLGGSDTGGEEIRIGLIVPKSGPYKAIGDDQAAGWRLALDKLGGRLGGRPVRVIEADEGDGKATALAAARKLIEQDKVLALVGGATADTVQTLYPLLIEPNVPLIGIGGRPSTVEDATYLWSTSWLSQETGASIASYLRDKVGQGRVWVIGPDYIGGHDQINGFVDAFRKAGGQLANPGGKPTWTPWTPAPTSEFSPYLTQIMQAAPAAVYTFYAGASAIEFVKQYRQYGVNIPLYASGFLTEGAPLAALGEQAKGIYTALNYSTTLDNAANRDFVRRYTAANDGKLPNIYHVCAWDAALVLDKAIAEALAHSDTPATTPATTGSPEPSSSTTVSPAAPATDTGGSSGELTSRSLTAALSRVGAIDSPRGAWQFGQTNHTPVQAYYLREVAQDGQVWVNRTVQTLTTLGS